MSRIKNIDRTLNCHGYNCFFPFIWQDIRGHFCILRLRIRKKTAITIRFPRWLHNPQSRIHKPFFRRCKHQNHPTRECLKIQLFLHYLIHAIACSYKYLHALFSNGPLHFFKCVYYLLQCCQQKISKRKKAQLFKYSRSKLQAQTAVQGTGPNGGHASPDVRRHKFESRSVRSGGDAPSELPDAGHDLAPADSHKRAQQSHRATESERQSQVQPGVRVDRARPAVHLGSLQHGGMSDCLCFSLFHVLEGVMRKS